MRLSIYRSATEGTGTENKPAEKSVNKGLQIRRFDGKIAEDKDTKKPEIKYVYPRVVLPWSRSGKDTDGKEVDGAVPTLSEVLAALNQSGFTTEFKLDKEFNPEGPSVVGLLIEGWNNYENRLARTKAENTPESAKENAIQVFMKKTGMNRADAMAFLSTAFGGTQ